MPGNWRKGLGSVVGRAKAENGILEVLNKEENARWPEDKENGVDYL